MFHIVFSADENYIPYTAVLMTSIIQNTNAKQTFKEICETKTLSAEFGETYANVRNFDFASLNKENQNEGYVFHILSNSINGVVRQKLNNLAKHLSATYPCAYYE